MEVIDLTKPLYTGMPVFPGDPEVEIETVHTQEKEGWELRTVKFGSHTGTHVDAFSHMHKGKATLDEIPLERFCGDAQVVQLGQEWPVGLGLFFKETVGVECLDKILAAKPRFVGGDLSEELEHALLEEEIITYTDLINLNRLPLHTTFTFFGLPLKIKEGDGSPVRAVAILDS